MAPKRGGGGSGGGGGLNTEETMQLSLPDEYKTSYTASAVVGAILMVLLFILFIWSIVNRRRWCKVPQSRFLTMTIWCSLFYFLGWVLSFMSFIAVLVEATVFESWVLIPGFQSTFSMLAELLLIGVLYYILHNRLRAVGIHSKALVFVHWSFLVIMILLSVVHLAGNWGYSATSLHDLKVDYYSSDDDWNADFMDSKFYRIHVRNIGAAFWVLRFVMQVEMIVLGVVVLFKSKVNPGGLKGMVFFLIGPLITYTITPLTIVIITFKYWDSTEYTYKTWLWLTPLQMGLDGFAEVSCISVICIFAVMTSHAQWELGTQGATQVAAVDVGEYKPEVPVYPNQPPPPAQVYYVPQQAPNYYVPQDQFR